MKNEIKDFDLRACVDNAHNDGYNKAVRKACKWIKNNFIYHGYGTSLYYKGILYDPKNIAEDLEKYMKSPVD